MHHVITIANPKALMLNERNALSKLQCMLGPEHKIFFAHTITELNFVLDLCAKHQVQFLLVAGGDGTVSMISRYLPKEYDPIVGILPLGTMNLIAKNIKISQNITQLIHQYKTMILNKHIHTISIPVLSINQRKGFIAALGGFANFVKWYKSKAPKNKYLALYLFLQVLFSVIFKSSISKTLFSSFSYSTSTQQQNHALSLCMSTIENLGYGFKPFGQSPIKHNHFFILELKNNLYSVVRNILKFLDSKNVNHPNIIQRTETELNITLTQALDLMIDGDMFGPVNTLNVKIDRHLRFLKP